MRARLVATLIGDAIPAVPALLASAPALASMPWRSRGPGQRQRGVSMVGLLVGMAIGLFTILVITQVLGNSAVHRRATMGAADAQQAGSLAMWRLSREVRMAGGGLQNGPFAWGCALNISRAGTPVLPRAGFPAPFAAVPGALRLQPVVVLDGGGAASDLLVSMGGRPAASNVPMSLNPASATTIGTGSTVGFVPGDLLLATVSSGIDDCHVGQVDSTYAALPNQPAPVTVPTSPAGSPFNTAAGFASLPAGRDWVLLNLGAAPTFSMFAVSPGVGLMQLDLLQPQTVAPTAFAENVVNLQVLMGVDDGSSGTADDNVIDAWVDASAAPWDFATLSGQGSSTAQLRIKALRVAMVVRSTERAGQNAPATLTLFADLPGRSVVVPVAQADRAYAHQVYDAVIPLREQSIALCSEQRRAAAIPRNGACG